LQDNTFIMTSSPESKLTGQKNQFKIMKKVHQFLTLVFPLLFSMSSLAGWISIFYYSFIFCVCVFFWQKRPKLDSVTPTDGGIIATFRVYILLFTMVAILAVDFNIFPQRFYKTHTYGASVMDIGVGAFVASNALASSDAKKFG
jgi:phosphatidylinositol glycan class W